ncbi:MAG: hypothetical protein A2150_01875 [Candidatus Muproteobacteria bacterium RBG_16_64_11]|uniref:Uncharacterized protein n=1 Tax=Candidatus Muproteobacteria bacterium RBG_16_64_11 TaxID=1817758 RepID=A0A1F6T9G1_9PROT|nr:MAG: hypothetical protein A2150_01875 [Candidatus Muproteobacteria bacterium RBG_16_64_11]
MQVDGALARRMVHARGELDLGHVVVDDSFETRPGGVQVEHAEAGEEQHQREQRGKAGADAEAAPAGGTGSSVAGGHVEYRASRGFRRDSPPSRRFATGWMRPARGKRLSVI